MSRKASSAIRRAGSSSRASRTERIRQSSSAMKSLVRYSRRMRAISWSWAVLRAAAASRRRASATRTSRRRSQSGQMRREKCRACSRSRRPSRSPRSWRWSSCRDSTRCSASRSSTPSSSASSSSSAASTSCPSRFAASSRAMSSGPARTRVIRSTTTSPPLWDGRRRRTRRCRSRPSPSCARRSSVPAVRTALHFTRSSAR